MKINGCLYTVTICGLSDEGCYVAKSWCLLLDARRVVYTFPFNKDLFFDDYTHIIQGAFIIQTADEFKYDIESIMIHNIHHKKRVHYDLVEWLALLYIVLYKSENSFIFWLIIGSKY